MTLRERRRSHAHLTADVRLQGWSGGAARAPHRMERYEPSTRLAPRARPAVKL